MNTQGDQSPAPNPPTHERPMPPRVTGYGVIVGLVVALVIAGFFLPRQAVWPASLTLIAAFLLAASRTTKGYWFGFLVNRRNRFSLSQFQMSVWTVLVVSALFSAALLNVRLESTDPTSVAIPGQLWVLMGISTASLVGSPMLLAPRDQARALDEKKREAASWADLFSGEERGNKDHLDLGRIQMFFFTLVLVLAYGAAIWNLFQTGSGPVRALPSVDEGMTVLLGISHTGYLAAKGVKHTPEEDDS